MCRVAGEFTWRDCGAPSSPANGSQHSQSLREPCWHGLKRKAKGPRCCRGPGIAASDRDKLHTRPSTRPALSLYCSECEATVHPLWSLRTAGRIAQRPHQGLCDNRRSYGGPSRAGHMLCVVELHIKALIKTGGKTLEWRVLRSALAVANLAT